MFAKEQQALSEVKAEAGASATLSCEVAQAQTEVTWFKDGKKLSSSSKVRVEASGCSRRLVVQQAGQADAGEYSCEAGGQKRSFRLDVTGGCQDTKPCVGMMAASASLLSLVSLRLCTLGPCEPWLTLADPMVFPLHFISSHRFPSRPHVQFSVELDIEWDGCPRKVLSFLCVWRDAPRVGSFIMVMFLFLTRTFLMFLSPS